MVDTASSISAALLTATVISPQSANAAFAPGGTLVTDREIGIQVGNPEASPSREQGNANVLFSQDHYFKFGAAAPWIEDGNTDFPKTMPFTLSQQRYDTLKKYGSRVVDGANAIQSVGDVISSGKDVADPSTSPIYALRPMGLLANGFLASENTGTTNELLLARWYVNEIYLRINDVRNASNKEEAMKSWVIAKKATNSYLALMNRVVTSKVGDKFAMLPV